MKRLLSVILLVSFMIIPCLASCDSTNPSRQDENFEAKKREVTLTVECEENLMFSKYNVEVYIDDNLEGVVNHGDKEVFYLELASGEHIIRFEKENDSSVYGEKKITVKGNGAIGYLLHCKNNKIEISKLNVEDSSSQDSESVSNELTESKPQDNNINVDFSKEYAQRAVIVAITNRNSPHVFSENGNEYDVSKFHSYSEKGDFYVEIYSDGVWEVINKTTWRVKNIKLKIKGINMASYVKVSTDVVLLDSDFVLKNIIIAQGSLSNLDSNDPNKLDIIEYSNPTDRTPYLIVPQRLILEDRTAYEENENAILANARLVFENYGKSRYPNGFKCNWLLGTLSKQIYSDNSVYLMVEVTVINNMGVKQTVIASGRIKNNTVQNFNIDSSY